MPCLLRTGRSKYFENAALGSLGKQDRLSCQISTRKGLLSFGIFPRRQKLYYEVYLPTFYVLGNDNEGLGWR